MKRYYHVRINPDVAKEQLAGLNAKQHEENQFIFTYGSKDDSFIAELSKHCVDEIVEAFYTTDDDDNPQQCVYYNGVELVHQAKTTVPAQRFIYNYTNTLTIFFPVSLIQLMADGYTELLKEAIKQAACSMLLVEENVQVAYKETSETIKATVSYTSYDPEEDCDVPHSFTLLLDIEDLTVKEI